VVVLVTAVSKPMILPLAMWRVLEGLGEGREHEREKVDPGRGGAGAGQGFGPGILPSWASTRRLARQAGRLPGSPPTLSLWVPGGRAVGGGALVRLYFNIRGVVTRVANSV
jgi:hypothetical protein